jgi:tetratricopeptide (TPR) repeat protein
MDGEKEQTVAPQKNLHVLRWTAALFLSAFFLFGTQIAVRNFLAEVNFYRSYELLNSPAYLQAEVPTKRAMRLNPQNGYTFYYYGAFLKKLGKKTEALGAFSAAMKTTAHPASVLRQLADMELDLKKYNLSADHYSLALVYDPYPQVAPGMTWYNYALAAQGAGRAGEALAAFRKAGNFEDVPASMGSSLSLLFAYLKAPAPGIQEFVYALEKHPEQVRDLSAQALALTQARLLDFGRDLFSRLDVLGKLDASGLCLLASFSLYKKDFDEAMHVLERAKKKNPQEANIYLLLGEIHFQKGDKEEMKKMYRKFLEMYPHAPQRSQLEKRILE